MSHRRTNHLGSQENESSCPKVASGYHRERLSYSPYTQPTIKGGWVALWSCVNPVSTPRPPDLLELNACNMQDPYTKVSQRLQVIRESHIFYLSLRLWQSVCDLYISLNVMEPPRRSTYHILDKVVSDVYLLEKSSSMGFLSNRIPPWLSQRITVVFIMCTNNSLKSFHN